MFTSCRAGGKGRCRGRPGHRALRAGRTQKRRRRLPKTFLPHPERTLALAPNALIPRGVVLVRRSLTSSWSSNTTTLALRRRIAYKPASIVVGSLFPQVAKERYSHLFLDHLYQRSARSTKMFHLAVPTTFQASARASASRAASTVSRRLMSSGHPLVRPGPPPLPRDQQREFEELVRSAQAPLSTPQRIDPSEKEADMALHPDARAPIAPEFEGEVNPATGEHGGPKREPVGRWGEGDGDWSFKGRVSDF